MANGQAVGPYFEQRLRTLADHPLIGDIRSCGLLAGVELVTSKRNKTKPDPALKLPENLAAQGYRNKLIFRAFSDGIVGFAPPLTCTREEIDLIVERFERTLNDMLDIKEVRNAID